MRDKKYAVGSVAVLALGIVLIAVYGSAGWFISLAWLLPIIIAIDLGISRGRTGWMWGLFLGWLGVLILAIMRPQPQRVRL